MEFTVGVFGRELSHFSLIYQPDFDNLIKIKYQQLISLTLDKGKKYYFDFFNKHEKYSTLLYAENSDVEVSALDYDESENQNFKEMIENEENFI